MKNDKFCWKKPTDLHMWATGTATITFVKPKMSFRKEATSVRLVILISPWLVVSTMVWILLDQTGKEIQQVPNSTSMYPIRGSTGMFESGYLPDPYWKQQQTNKCKVWQELHRLGNSFISLMIRAHMHNRIICHWYGKHFQSFAGFNGFKITYLLYQLGSFRTTYTIWRNVRIFKKKKLLWKIALDKESSLEYLIHSSTDCVLKLTMYYYRGPILQHGGWLIEQPTN